MTLVNQALLNTVEHIARRAGDAIMDIYARDFSVEEKDDKSPLTEADQAAHRLITEALAELPEAMPVLSEEDDGTFGGADAHQRYWLVDPLDGTKEFIKRNGEFTVNIALISQGRSVLGVVVAPALHTAYVAAQGLGAYKVEADGSRHRIHVAKKPAPGTPWRVVGSRCTPARSWLPGWKNWASTTCTRWAARSSYAWWPKERLMCTRGWGPPACGTPALLRPWLNRPVGASLSWTARP